MRRAPRLRELPGTLLPRVAGARRAAGRRARVLVRVRQLREPRAAAALTRAAPTAHCAGAQHGLPAVITDFEYGERQPHRERFTLPRIKLFLV